LAFQLQDDWLDVYGDPKVFGKNIGGDILCNKKTYMLITALEQADADQRKELEGWLSAIEYNPAEKVAAVTALYDAIGVGQRCQEKVEAYYNEALAVLDSVALPEERKQTLKDIARSLMGRKV
jgi:geranylgeranyl diphosphate synthase type II